jgi:hypothetical protein
VACSIACSSFDADQFAVGSRYSRGPGRCARLRDSLDRSWKQGKIAFGRKRIEFDAPTTFTWTKREDDDADFVVGTEESLGANILHVKKIACCSIAMKFGLTIANMET